MVSSKFTTTNSNGNTKSTGSSAASSKDDLFTQIDDVVTTAKESVSKWQDKQDKYYRMRMRIKKGKTYPFKNSSNLRMPTADVNIKKVKASIMQQIFGASPVVQASPTPSGSIDLANKIEKFLDHLVMDVMDIKNKSEICIDQSLEKGFYIGKVFWRLTIVDRDEELDFADFNQQEQEAILNMPEEAVVTEIIKRLDIDMSDNIAEENIAKVEKAVMELKEKQGVVKFSAKDVTYNFPDVDFVSPDRVFVPTDSGFDPQKAKSITVEIFKPLCELKSEGKLKGYDMEKINSIEGLSSVKQEGQDLDKDMQEGIERLNNPSGLVRIWESVGDFDIGNKRKELSLITTLPDFSMTIRKVKMTNFSNKYNIVKFFYELTEDRWFAHRGIPEALEDIIKEIDVQHNMKIDYQTMNVAPMLVYRSGMINPRTAKVNPAAAIPVQGLQSLDDTIKAINLHNPNAEFSYEREQQILETKIQEYVGQIDFGLQSQINRRQPRTLGEVELQQAGASATF